MQKKKQKVIFGSVKVMLAVAFLSALSIVCGKYLAIRGGDVLRFSFENLPVLMTGMIFGPVAGVASGVIADLLGCVLVGYAINPLVTVGAAAIGLLGGILYRLCRSLPLAARLGISVFGAHLVGSVIIKTFGLAQFYDMPFLALTAWRGLNYLIIGALEWVLIWLLLRNKALSQQLEKMKH